MEENKSFQINFLEFFSALFKAIRRSIRPLLIINGVILIAGITYRLTTDLAFTGSVMIKSNFVEFNYIEELIEPLNQHVNDRRPEGLVRTLQIDEALARKMGKVSVESIIDEEYVTKRKLVAEEDLGELERDLVFKLTVSSSSTKDLSAIKNAVLDYLKSQPFLKSREEFYQKKRKLLAEKMENDLISMDSIKKSYTELKLGNRSNPGIVLIQDIGDFYFGSTKVYEEYLVHTYNHNFNKSIEEISTFEYFDKYASPRWTAVLVFTLFTGIFATILYLFLLEVNRYQP